MNLNLYNGAILVARQLGDKLVKVEEDKSVVPIALFANGSNSISIDEFLNDWVVEHKMPESNRVDLDDILARYNVKCNTPIEWIQATECRTLEDDFWIRDEDYVNV